jgi:hypothetical protein
MEVDADAEVDMRDDITGNTLYNQALAVSPLHNSWLARMWKQYPVDYYLFGFG